ALIWIAYKLGLPQDGSTERIVAAATVGAAVRTIVIADAVMGVDNVLAIGGAAQGRFLLVVLGLAISIPVAVWGSTPVLNWLDLIRFIGWIPLAMWVDRRFSFSAKREVAGD